MTADVLSGAKPQMSHKMAAELVQTIWGIVVDKVTQLNAERDLNLYMTGKAGEFVFKCANSAESFATTLLQTQALLHLEKTNPEVQVPRIQLTAQGASEVIVDGHTVRLLSWMSGRPWHETTNSPLQRHSIATAHANMVLALADFSSEAPPPYLMWDVQHTADLGVHLTYLPSDLFTPVTNALALFNRHAAPYLADLPRQWCHNDIQPHNVVMQPQDTDQIAGFLDFGDMVFTPVICDLAVALAYNIHEGPHAYESVVQYLVPFHRLRPLSELELMLLPALIMARHCTTLIITAWRAALYPENAPYILRNQPMAKRGLFQLIRLPYADAISYLRNHLDARA